jgi:hypothetical protein
MDCDLLLTWMTHIGEGSWARFRNAVEELAGSDGDLSDLCRRLRMGLSDLGFAEFFVEETQRWKTLPPILGRIAAQDGAAVFCGGRSPIVVDSLTSAAELHGCQSFVERPRDCPALIRIVGAPEKMAVVADQIGVAFEPNLPAILAAKLVPMPDRMANAPRESAPLNWKVHSFDFRKRHWVDKLLPNSACEYTPAYGPSRYFVHRKRGRLLRLSKRESLYVAAMLNGVRLVEYERATRVLSVPLFAPLPESYSRTACLCSGRPADVADGRITYGGVPPDLAAILTVAAGQAHPAIESTAGTGR